MALASYSDLTTALANWSGRTDLTSRLPELVTLAEADFNNDLRVADMEVLDQNFQIIGEYAPLPANFLEVRDFYIPGSTPIQLTYLPAEIQTGFYSVSDTPRYYSIAGTKFRFAPPPSGTSAATLRYYQTIPGLQANTVNWLMTKRPSIYVANCMLQLSLLIKDTEAMQYWATAYQMELSKLKASDQRTKVGGSAMAVRAV